MQFLGEIKLFAGSVVPTEWNFCDGTLLSISGNEALYTLIGTTYGGDGVSTFAVPDLRGRVPIHVGQGNHNYQVGETGGLETVTLISDNLPAHNHTLVVSSVTGTDASPKGDVLAVAPQSSQMYIEANPTVAFAAQQVQTSNPVSAAHENRQPYQAINYIIALAGVFPSQGE